MAAKEWFRVDDRLIHGQVMVGWVIDMGIGEIVIANDKIVSDEWRKDVLRGAVESFSDEVTLTILSLADSVPYMHGTVQTKRLLLVESLRDASELYSQGLNISRLNLGGIHSRKGRLELLPFLSLDSDEIRIILTLADKGIMITAQDLPSSRTVDVVGLIKRKRCL